MMSIQIRLLMAVVVCGAAAGGARAANTHSLDLERSSSQYASCADSAGLSVTGDFTIEAWVRIEQLPSDAGGVFRVVTKNNVGNNERAYQTFFSNANDMYHCDFYADKDASTWTRFRMDEAFDDGDVGTWVHLAVSVDVSGPAMYFYKNGDMAYFISTPSQARIIVPNKETFTIYSNIKLEE